MKRFIKVPLAAGESRTNRFHLTRDDLTFIGRDGKPTAEAGTFTVMVGTLPQEMVRR